MNLFFVSASGLKLLFLICSSALLLGCQERSGSRRAVIRQESTSAPAEEKNPVAKQDAPILSLPDFEHLYPVEIVKPESRNVYEKYGIEFSGVCYACDLAEIRINPQAIELINVCDDKDIYRIPDFKYTIDERELVAENNGQVLIFTKVDKAPVYALEIKGKSFSFENKRIIKYYVPKKIIGKFKQHDCGDFQG